MPNAQRAMGAENWSNRKYAGSIYRDYKDEDLHQKYPDGVPFSYEGLPQFEKYVAATVVFKDGFTGNRPADNRMANKELGYTVTPPGMKWHHHEDGKTMHLMDKFLHDDVRHWGGVRVVEVRRQRDA